MADGDDHHYKNSVLQAAEDAEVSHAIAPIAFEFSAERFAELLRIGGTPGALVEVGDDLGPHRGAELAEIAQRVGLKPIVPVHASPHRGCRDVSGS